MATRVEAFQITTPAGTPQATPQDTPLAMSQGYVDRLELVIPGGHAGLTGFALFHSGQQVIPFAAGEYLRGDDNVIPWDLSGYPVGSAWVVRTYNVDVYDHTHHLRLLITDLGLEVPAAPQVAPVVVVPEAAPEQLAAAAELPAPTDDELLAAAELMSPLGRPLPAVPSGLAAPQEVTIQ